MGLFLVFTISSCAYLPINSATSVAKIEQLIEQRRFGQAQTLISEVPLNAPDYSVLIALQKNIEAQAAAYEKLTLEEAGKLEQQGQWYLAMELYQQGQKNLAGSARMKAAEQALQGKIDARVAALEFDLLMAKGEWLRQQLSYQSNLARLSPSQWLTGMKRGVIQRESKKVAEELNIFGHRAMDQGDFSLADSIFGLTLQLHPDPEIEAARTALGQKRRQAVVNNKRDTRRDLSISMEQALTEERLGEASRLAKQIKTLGKLSQNEQEVIQKLNLMIRQKVNANMELGVSHYGSGEYSRAIAAWQDVLDLEPDNSDATEHIARAERVLEKLQSLRENR